MDRFAALAEPNRRRMLELLARGPCAAGTIAAEFELSPPAVSQHLKALRESGLVQVEVDGQRRIYSLDPDGLATVDQWLSQVRSFWSARLDDLDAALEQEKGEEMSDYGIVTEAGAVRFERLLAAPVERVWEYLTQSELRRKWFAAGDMELRPGGALTLVFRNSELSHHDEEMPEKYRQYEGMESRGEVVEADPPRRLVFDWFEDAAPPTRVSWELEPRGEQTLLTLVHSRLPNRAMSVDVSGGWHLHLDMLEDMLAERHPRPFWSTNERYAREYEDRIPA